MKKIIVFSFILLSSSIMTSCTADALSDVPQTGIHADDGGEHGIPVPPPPPPPPPGIGTGSGKMVHQKN